MWGYLIRRLAQAAMVVAIMAAIVFFGVNVIGSPVDILINPEFDQAELERAIRALGLDKPLHEQFYYFIKNALQGDLGTSFVYGEPALQIIIERMPATMELALTSLLLSIVLGVPLGMYAGLRPNSPFSKTVVAGSILGFSLPTFWVGIMMILLFAVLLGWLPSTGRGDTVDVFGIEVSFLTWNGLTHLAMPAINLALLNTSLVLRLARAGAKEAALQDYVKFARAKGMSESRIVLRHVLKNIMIPVVTVLGLEFGGLIAFSVVTESVFSWPGMGKLIIESIQVLDRPVVVAYLMMTVLLFVTINFVVDIVYSLLDPRVRMGGAGK
ncbi:MAG: ABC transporter permease [Alphaproteobacteria bacterium]